jgi:hypothetical protein
MRISSCYFLLPRIHVAPRLHFLFFPARFASVHSISLLLLLTCACALHRKFGVSLASLPSKSNQLLFDHPFTQQLSR